MRACCALLGEQLFGTRIEQALCELYTQRVRVRDGAVDGAAIDRLSIFRCDDTAQLDAITAQLGEACDR